MTAPLCKNCRHYIEGKETTFDMCSRPGDIDPVRGEESKRFCLHERQSYSSIYCNAEGRFFESKEGA